MSTVPNILDNEQGVCCYCSFFSKITKKKQQQTFPQETCTVKHFALKNHSSFCFCPSRIIGAGKNQKCGLRHFEDRRTTTPASKPGFSNPSMKEGPRSRSFPGPKGLRPAATQPWRTGPPGELKFFHIRRWVETWPSCQGFWGVGGSSRIGWSWKIGIRNSFPLVFVVFWFRRFSTHGKRSDEYFFAPEKQKKGVVNKVFQLITKRISRWCFQRFFNFHPEPWGNDPIWRASFSDGLVQLPTRIFMWDRLCIGIMCWGLWFLCLWPLLKSHSNSRKGPNCPLWGSKNPSSAEKRTGPNQWCDARRLVKRQTPM